MQNMHSRLFTTDFCLFEGADDYLDPQHVNIFCPRGYRADPRYSVIHVGKDEQIETFTMYCVTCASGTYSLAQPLTTINKMTHISVTQNSEQQCIECPYGAHCDVNVKAKANFWGELVNGKIFMYICPPTICCSGENCFSYDSCAPFREGLLCSKCVENYSQSWFTSKCIADGECQENLWIWGLVACVGVIYVILFIMEEELSIIATHFSRFVRKKCLNVNQFLKNVFYHNTELVIDRSEFKENPDFRSAYLEIFMYYVQVPDLFKVNIIYKNNRSKPIDGFQTMVNKLYSFNTIGFDIKTCLFKGVRAVYKGIVKCSYIGYLFIVCGSLYGITKCLTCNDTPTKMAKVKKIIAEKHQPLDVRFALTFCSLLVYTYQYLAENCFILLQCVKITSNENPVLFIDPYITCYTFQQYIVICFVCIYVLPFAFSLLLSPVLLKEKFIGVRPFLVSFGCPAFMLPYFIYCHIRRHINHTKRSEDSANDEDDARMKKATFEINESGTKIIDTLIITRDNETGRAISAAFIDAYRVDLPLSLCWEGVMTLRRLVLAIVSTFVGNVLYSHMALMVVTFMSLALHLSVKPFKNRSCNTVETISLMMHLFFSIMNLLKASYFQSGEVPIESADNLFYIYDYIEFAFLGIFPSLLFAFVGIAVLSHVSVYVVDMIRRLPHGSRSAGQSKNDATDVDDVA